MDLEDRKGGRRGVRKNEDGDEGGGADWCVDGEDHDACGCEYDNNKINSKADLDKDDVDRKIKEV